MTAPIPRIQKQCASRDSLTLQSRPQTPAAPRATYCNPMDLPYKFQPLQAGNGTVPGMTSYREAADPSMVVFKDTYFLFVSKSGGYWYSKDLNDWTMVVPVGLPLDDYAPTAFVMNDKIYWTASHSGAVFATDDPWESEARWYNVGDMDKKYHDPFFFQDDDKKVYFSWGCSPFEPIYMVEVDPKSRFAVISDEKPLIYKNQTFHGWESAKFGFTSVQSVIAKMIGGDSPYIEGSWINKVNGRYIHQYATPGTELRAYGDGVYVSDVSPMGPYTRDQHSPVSHKPSGFIPGAGHGSTFEDLKGNWWHVATGLISERHNFERRLMLFPAYVEPGKFPAHFQHGDMKTSPSLLVDTMQGDFPIRIDQTKPGWQLLSLFKDVTASTILSEKHRTSCAVDEDISTWWSAEGDDGEWLAVDIGHEATLHAIQINFADHDAVTQDRLHDAYRYYVEVSADGKKWQMLEGMDRQQNSRDSPHDYTELARSIVTRHFRITSTCVPGGARFSISGLRLFGIGPGEAPQAVSSVNVARKQEDLRVATVSWKATTGAQYYVLRWGVQHGPLFQNMQVYKGATEAALDSLSTDVVYNFVVDAVNEAGVTRGVSLATA